MGTSNPPRALALLVDDDPDLLDVIEVAVRAYGLDVLRAERAEQALAGLDPARLERLSLLVTDVVLPGMSGIGLLERLRIWRPELPVLLVSGYMGPTEANAPHTDAHTAYLSKPFSLDQLRTGIDELLAVRATAR